MMLDDLNIIKIYSKNNLMYMAIIELTTNCNFRCKHCFIDSFNNYGLDTVEIKKLLYELRTNGVYEVQFTGGEIFLRKDIVELITYARALKFKVILLTNLYLIDDAMIKFLQDVHVELISTTLFSLDEEKNDNITNFKGSTRKIINNLIKISRTNIRVQVKTIVMKDTEEDYIEIQKFCKNNNIEYLATEGIFPSFGGCDLPRKLSMTNQQLKDNIENLDKIRFGDIYYKEKSDDECICCELNYSLFISSDGNIYPCNLWFKKLGNIKNNSIQEIWNSKYLRDIKNTKWKDLHKCSNCDKKNFCIRCTGIVYSLKNDILLEDEFACRTAKIRKSLYEKKYL